MNLFFLTVGWAAELQLMLRLPEDAVVVRLGGAKRSRRLLGHALRLHHGLELGQSGSAHHRLSDPPPAL